MNEDSVHNTETKPTHRRYNVATVVVFGLVLLGGLLLLYYPRLMTLEVFAPKETEFDLQIQGEVLAPSEPVHLSIPRINVEADFSAPLGLTEEKEIQVPEDYASVGYYKFGPTPGELGPAVILGHVDSFEGPAVFFSLGQLTAGDVMHITRADGTVATFAVTELERHNQAAFPTRKVYGDIDHAGLRLITCTGIYEKDALRYTHNLIVFAKLVSTSTIPEG